MAHRTLILLGGNLPETRMLFDKAMQLMPEFVGDIVKVSSVYESASWGFEAESSFLNQVVEVNTSLPPDAQLSALLDIEKILGRQRKSHGTYESRGIDLDILFIDDCIIETDNLTVPHPRLHLRRFTLEPLCECWAEMIHPVFKEPMLKLLNECLDKGLVKRCT